MLLGMLAACKTPTGTENGTTETPAGDPTTPENPPVVDSWVDVWDQNPTFEPLTDDTKYDGSKVNGTWFDSFKNNTNSNWASRVNGKMTFSNGQMHVTSSSSSDTVEAFRSVFSSDHFEAEARIKVDDYGTSNAFYIAMNGKRAIVYLLESKIRIGIDREDENEPRAEFVYVDVGYDWHTYKFCGHNGLVDLYMDGVLLKTFKMQASGSASGIAFYASAAFEHTPTTMHVEYASYTVLSNSALTITSPKGGATVGTGVSNVGVTAKVSSSLVSQNETVSFYLNGIFAGSVKSNAPVPSVMLKDLAPGVYTVYAKCGDTVSSECVFYIKDEADAEGAEPVYSTSSKLQSGYVLKFKLNGNGALQAGDGYYPLKLSFSNGKLTYKTLDGDETVTAGNGDYIAVVDGGVAWIYCNGRILGSYRMPYESCGTTVVTDGGVSNLTVEKHTGTLLQKNYTGAVAESFDPGVIPYNYALEFEYTKGHDLALSMSEGAFFLNLAFAADGTVKGTVAPLLTPFEQVLTQVKDGTHLYRVSVSNGIGQLFADNVWIASWKLPRTVADRNLYLNGSGIGMLRITEIKDLFYFSADRTDADWNDYFAPPKVKENDIVNIKTDWESESRTLKLFSKNTTVSATLDLTANTTGCFYLIANYFNGLDNYAPTGVVAGYDFDAKCFKMGWNLKNLTKRGTATIPTTKTKVVLTLTVIDQKVTLYCDGTVVAEADYNLNGWGNAGYSNALKNGTFKSFTYEGDGNPLVDSATTLIKDRHTCCIYELNNKTYIVAESGYRYTTNDGGNNFSLAGRSDRLDFHAVVLKSGKILSIKRVVEGDGMKYYQAWITSDNGTTFKGPYRIHTDKNTYRFTMNGRVTQMSNGRVIFVSGECKNENEDIGGLRVYYSDDEGVTWKESSNELNYETTGQNLQEGVVIELPDGTVRLYARNDGGFLVYTESKDNGKTWDLQIKASNFPSVVSAFYVNRDVNSSDVYMAWEYNCINDSAIIQFPRTRIGLAVSRDGCQTWDYVGDIDESGDIGPTDFSHWNIGVWTTTDSVYVTSGKTKADGLWYNNTVRISKDTIKASARFNSLHGPFSNPTKDPEGMQLWVSSVLAISPTTGRVYASGDYYHVANVNGKRTMLTVEMIASFLHGAVTVEGNAATVTLGTAEYVFTAGSKTALINGEAVEMTFEATMENGMVSITVEDLDNLFGLTARKTEHGAIVLTVDPSPVRLEYILAGAGIW